MYDFSKLPKERHKEFLELYENAEIDKCYDIINKYGINDNYCLTCKNLYELKQWVIWALTNDILLKN